MFVDGIGAARLETEDGQAVCTFEAGDREFTVGTVVDEGVRIVRTYGGGVVSMEDLEDAIASIDTDSTDWREQRRAMGDAIAGIERSGDTDDTPAE